MSDSDRLPSAENIVDSSYHGVQARMFREFNNAELSPPHGRKLSSMKIAPDTGEYSADGAKAATPRTVIDGRLLDVLSQAANRSRKNYPARVRKAINYLIMLQYRDIYTNKLL